MFRLVFLVALAVWGYASSFPWQIKAAAMAATIAIDVFANRIRQSSIVFFSYWTIVANLLLLFLCLRLEIGGVLLIDLIAGNCFVAYGIANMFDCESLEYEQ